MFITNAILKTHNIIKIKRINDYRCSWKCLNCGIIIEQVYALYFGTIDYNHEHTCDEHIINKIIK